MVESKRKKDAETAPKPSQPPPAPPQKSTPPPSPPAPEGGGGGQSTTSGQRVKRGHRKLIDIKKKEIARKGGVKEKEKDETDE